MADVYIKEVTTEKDLKEFVKFPYKLYKGVPYWTPPLLKSEFRNLDKENNPSFKSANTKLILAYKNGKIAGRIMGIISNPELDFIKKKHARFGWLDFIDDTDVTDALFGTIEKWALENGMNILKGPYGFTDLDPAGMLVEGFEEIGTLVTTFNYPYFLDHLTRLGYRKDVDWLEFEGVIPKNNVPKFKKKVKYAKEKYGLRAVKIKDKKELLNMTKDLFILLSDTYRELHGFVPFSEKMIRGYVKQYYPVLRHEFVCLVENEKGEKVGFSLAVPSLVKALKKINGKLFPFGWYHIKKAVKNNDTAELYLIGVKSEWRGKGVTGVIFDETFKAFTKAGIKKVLINPMLEKNSKVLSLWTDYTVRQHRRRRAFIKEL